MKILAYILPLIFASSALGQQSESSTKVYAILGLGFPEMIHGGVRLNHKQWHFDASGGSTFRKKEFAVNGNVAYHFGSKKLGKDFIQKPWYTSLGMSYLQWANMGYNYQPSGTTEEIQAIGKEAHVNGRVGRDFRINSWFNLSLSFGFGGIIYKKVHYYFGGPGMWAGLSLPVTLSGQFSLQFKLWSKKT